MAQSLLVLPGGLACLKWTFFNPFSWKHTSFNHWWSFVFHYNWHYSKHAMLRVHLEHVSSICCLTAHAHASNLPGFSYSSLEVQWRVSPMHHSYITVAFSNYSNSIKVNEPYYYYKDASAVCSCLHTWAHFTGAFVNFGNTATASANVRASCLQ